QPVHGLRPLHVALHFLGGAPLVGRVLVQECGLELTLPRRIRREGEAGRELAPRVEIEQLRRHPVNRRPRLVALPRPRRRAQPVQPRWRRLAVSRRPVRLELVEAIQRHVEAGAAFVLDYGDLEAATFRPNRDGLDATVNPDAVLEMDHEVPTPEGPGRRAGDRLAIAPRAPQPPRHDPPPAPARIPAPARSRCRSAAGPEATGVVGAQPAPPPRRPSVPPSGPATR